MSSFLYRLGRWSYLHHWRVVGAWVLILALLGGGALLLNKGTDNTFKVPGTESQTALDSLARTFPQVSGSSAQIIVVAGDGASVRDSQFRHAITSEVQHLEHIDGVETVSSPFSSRVKGGVSSDGVAALVRVQLSDITADVPAATKTAIEDAGSQLEHALPASAQVKVGGDLYSQEFPSITPTEGVGLLIALVVLFLVFRSFIAAGMPLASAILGVGISMALIFLATTLTDVSSTTPLLALMLGLAVGIDYALFVISRHQQQLRDGIQPEESAARATATAGSAVVFAGVTVLIALVGLSIAQIPFLTTMGIAAAAAVAIAVCVALTITPAFLGFAGARLIPKPRTAKKRPRKREHRSLFDRWVAAATKWPPLTIALVVVILGIATVPAAGLRLALPDAGALSTDTQARQGYDLTAEHFGAGYNGPLIVTGSIINSTDPVGLMNDLGDELREVKGVASVPLSTPNETGDTGIVQVVPTTGPSSEGTTELVNRIRGMHDHFQHKYGIDLAVTGQTAVAIDVSDRLGGALIPFGIFVVGLSLVLLMMVFRSIAVPIKATLGYLLSVGAAFGMTTLVFVDGYGADLIHVAKVGPVISFLPIILMGVLFGLAMDYEVFLVSRMREEYTHNGGHARRAIRDGFNGSASVVTAAAVIMFCVFAAFVPEGDTNIKPIAFGLAVGVFADAFLVRMTLVPAVMALLGDRAWWMPRWLSKRLPAFDVEGEAIGRELALADWPEGDLVVAARNVEVRTLDDTPVVQDLTFTVARGTRTLLTGADADRNRTALMAIAGRVPVSAGDVKVDGFLLPERAPAVRRRCELVLLDGGVGDLERLRAALTADVPLVLVDGLERVTDPRVRDAMRLDFAATAQFAPTVAVLASGTAEDAELLTSAHGGVDTVTLSTSDERIAL